MAMIKSKNITFSLILMCLIVVSPMATALLGGLGATVNIININGMVMCSIDGGVSGIISATSIPPFPNASVNLTCGTQVVATATTGVNGAFSIPLTTPISASTLTSPDCKLTVVTPLATCDASLTAPGLLTSELTTAGTIVNGLLSIFNLVPSGFHLV